MLGGHRTWGAVVVVSTGVIVAFLVLAIFVLPGPVTAGTLDSAVASATGADPVSGPGVPGCVKRISDGGLTVWRCDVGVGSSSVEYLVFAHHPCWKAIVFSKRAHGLPGEVSGCIRLIRIRPTLENFAIALPTGLGLALLLIVGSVNLLRRRRENPRVAT